MLTKLISRFLLFLFRKQAIAIYGLSFLFLPGVILHELSHLLVASVLFVPTGEVEFFPEVHGNQVKMGSVAIAHTDPLRRFLIGIAPLLGGLAVMLGSATFLSGIRFAWQNLALLYIVFEIANTMFSSDKDMDGAVGFFAATIGIAFVLQILGLPLWSWGASIIVNNSVQAFFLHINIFLAMALAVDLCAIGFLVFLLEVYKRFASN